MSLAEKFAAGPPQADRRCAVCILLTNLDPTEAETLKKMLLAPSSEWSDAETWAALKDEGHLLHLKTDQALGSHRRRCMT